MSKTASNHSHWLLTLQTSPSASPVTRVWQTTSPMAIGHPLRFVVERTKQGFRVRDLKKLEVTEIGETQAKPVQFDGLLLSLQPVPAHSKSVTVPALLSQGAMQSERANSWDRAQIRSFRKSSLASSASLALLLLVSWLTPKSDPKKEELIPPQFAKLLMSPALKAAQKSQNQAQSAANDKGGKSAGVVQAFRSQAVQKSAKTLLTGAMSKLLMRSALMAPSQAKVTQLFSAVENTRAPSAAGNTELKSVQMAALGGASNGAGVGYGAGEKAGVANQGSGFVGLDTGESLVEEGLSKDEVGRVIHSHLAEVRYCYESAMIKNPNVQGKLMVDFTIAGAGKVDGASVKDSSVTDRTLDQCLIAKLKQWQFPSPKGGVKVAVTYPFIFKTLGK